MERVIRVGTATNFNFSLDECDALTYWQGKRANRESHFFVNANGETPIYMDPGVPIVLTLNPYLDRFIAPDVVSPGPTLEKRLSWVRIKWCWAEDNGPVAKAYEAALDWVREKEQRWGRKIPVVRTIMRFFSKASLAKYSIPSLYQRAGAEWEPIITSKMCLPSCLTCDPTGGGCATCGLCSILTTGKELPIYALDLEESLPEEGHCKYACPDCWAKRILARAAHVSHGRPKVDCIRQNGKQKKKGKK